MRFYKEKIGGAYRPPFVGFLPRGHPPSTIKRIPQQNRKSTDLVKKIDIVVTGKVTERTLDGQEITLPPIVVTSASIGLAAPKLGSTVPADRSVRPLNRKFSTFNDFHNSNRSEGVFGDVFVAHRRQVIGENHRAVQTTFLPNVMEEVQFILIRGEEVVFFDWIGHKWFRTCRFRGPW